MRRNKNPTAYQHPFPAIPERWNDDEKRFAHGLRELFDQLFARRVTQDETDGHKITYAGKSVTIPDNDTTYTKLSDFTNDTGFITQAAVDQSLAIMVDFGTVSSLPQTANNVNITSDMTVEWFEMSDPTAFTSNLTVTTDNGSVTVNGTMDGSSTLKIKLGHTA